jgi:membrane-associated phospholipid phosphatase
VKGLVPGLRFLPGLLLGPLVFAQTPAYQRDDLFQLPSLLWDDATSVVTAPGDWTASDWTKAGWGAAAVLGVALVLDKPLADGAARSQTASRDRLASHVAQAGGTGGLVFMGAGYLGLGLLGQDEARSVFVDMGIATVLAQTAILPLKYGAGRARPADGLGDDHFTPFTSHDSFPSGHATQAFAMASVVSMRCDQAWIGWCAYGAAGLVGAARLETRDHFASDVVTGALVGTCIGREVVRVNRKLRSRTGRAEVTFTPALAPGFRGVTMTARF